MQDIEQTEDLLTAPSAGLILKKSASTVQRMARKGQLPVAQKLPGPNGAFLFRRKEIEDIARKVEDLARGVSAAAR